MGLPKSDRLLYILNLVRARKNLNAVSLARECGVTERTIYRDILSLSETNIPIYYDRGYKLASDLFLPPLNFTFDEYSALKMALESSVLGQTGKYEKTLGQVKAKVEAGLSRQVNSERKTTRDITHIEIPTSHGKLTDEDVFGRLEEAINDCRSLKITYDAIESGLAERIVEPYFIIFRARSFYFVAFCHLRSMFRTFRLDRIRSLELTENQFIRQPDINARDYFKGSWDVFSGEPVDIEVRFSGSAAKVVRGSQHHPGEEIEEISDDELLYRVRVNGTQEISRWIIGFGDKAVVVAPEKLRDEFRALGEFLRGKYSSE